jgi:hypothetical protein
MATNERRLDLLELVAAKLPNAWERMFEAGLESPGAMNESERLRWVEILIHPRRKDLPTTYLLWDWLHRITDLELPASVISNVLQEELLVKVPEPEQGSAYWVELVAAVCPAAHRQKLRKQLTKLDPSHTVTPLALLEILDGMEKDRTHV